MFKVFLIGNLTRDPEVRQSGSGKDYLAFGLAVNQRAQNGEQESVFFNVRAFSRVETLQKYLQKGKKVAVTGTMSMRLYDANDGTKRIAADVMMDDFEFLPSAPPPEGGYQPRQNTIASEPPFGGSGAPAESGFSQVEDDDLPF